MKCPACGNDLHEVKVSDVVVDICRDGCGGIWFDNFELLKFDEPHEADGEELVEFVNEPKVSIDHSKRLNCPKCENVVLMRHFFSVKKQVEVDECPGCGGMWLDAGELKQIRQLYDTEEQRRAAAKEYFGELFSEHFERMKAENEEKLRKTRRMANMFRFICPTYYIPGKQHWGAF